MKTTTVLSNLFFLLFAHGIGLSQETNINLSADEVISRIKKNVDCTWLDETVDTYKGGNGSMEVTGIATTFLATMEVLKKAKAKGLNLIITHEPTFYNHLDKTEQFDGDAIVAAKQKYIKDNDLIVFRFHDHIHRTSEDGIYRGVIDKFGWGDYEKKQRPYVYEIPGKSLKELSEELKIKFKTETIRVVGNPDMNVSNVGMVLGAAGSTRQIEVLQRDDVEVLIIGETHEWETVEYVRDAVNIGKKKALILLGHANSEEPGMNYCAEWLKTFVAEVPIEFVPAGDPFWTPK